MRILVPNVMTDSVVHDDARVWVLDRRDFQQIMLRTGMQRLADNVRFLRSVPLLQRLAGDVLARLADVLEVVGLLLLHT